MNDPTHLALPMRVARAARMVLGKLPHDELVELLRAWDTDGKTVSLEDPKPELVVDDG